jgi:hypothetical protein
MLLDGSDLHCKLKVLVLSSSWLEASKLKFGVRCDAMLAISIGPSAIVDKKTIALSRASGKGLIYT